MMGVHMEICEEEIVRYVVLCGRTNIGICLSKTHLETMMKELIEEANRKRGLFLRHFLPPL